MKYMVLIVALVGLLVLTACGPDPIEMERLKVERAEAEADEAYQDAKEAASRAEQAQAQADADIIQAQVDIVRAHRDQVITIVNADIEEDRFQQMIIAESLKRLDAIRQLYIVQMVVTAMLALAAIAIAVVYVVKRSEQKTEERTYTVEYRGARYELTEAAWFELQDLDLRTPYRLLESGGHHGKK